MGKNGGARPGAGMPKGYKLPKTLEKIEARELVRKLVTAGLEPMIRAQMAHAGGIGHLYTRDENGKFKRVENEAEMERLLTQGTQDSDYWIFSKDPSAQAFKELLDRALDKPKEQATDVNMNVTGDADLLARLDAGRQRVAAAKKGGAA